MASPFRVPAHPLPRLLLAVLALLPLLSGRAVHAQTPSVIDVAVFYTTAAKNAQGGTAQIETKIDELVVSANMAYTDSDVNQSINLVAAEEVAYPETETIRTDLRRLRDPSDGYLDEVHTLRDQVHADIVILLRAQEDGEISGIAYTMATESTAHARLAFGVSIVSASIFTHELGHIMGLFHDRYDACRHNTATPQCPSSVVAPYAYGYVNQAAFESGAATSKRWRTIMAANHQCRAQSPPFDCDRVHFFSDPDNVHPDADGDPMGVSGTQDTTAVDGPADAAQALNDTRDTVADFRQGRAVKVSFAAGSYAVTEGGSVTVTVQLDTAPGRTLDIPLAATSTTGAWPGDYSLPESVTFSASQTTRTVTFRATQDTRQEDEETVTLGFGAPLPAGVSVGSQAEATVTLTDNDTVSAAPSVSTVSIISDPGAGYAAGEEIVVAVVFTKPISVTGTPSIELTVGTNTRTALCQDAASEVLTCTYTVVADESDTDGVSVVADSLARNGGTIQDEETTPQNATLAHTAVAADSDHTVEGDTPDLESAEVDEDTVTLTYDEALDETSVPWADAFTVTAGGSTVLIAAVRVSGAEVTLTLVSGVAHTDSVTLTYSPSTGTPSLRDAAGNAAATLSSYALTNNTPQPVYDTDDDGLIDITTLAQLDAIRHDLDGDGIPTTAGAADYAAAFPNVARVVCGATSGGCEGYELRTDLDFLDTNGDGQVDTDDDTNGDGQVDAEDNTTYWNNGTGWEPIGATASNRFDTTFEGNGYTINNLFIKKQSATDPVGLFGRTGFFGDIRHVGLLDAEVTGNRTVGGLVGWSAGDIAGSYTTGRVIGKHWVGGLVGFLSHASATLRASYATGWVSGSSSVGGLVGLCAGDISASYATGRVSGSYSVGGLVGLMHSNGLGNISASYATGRVSGTRWVGGLVGRLTGDISASYATGRVSGSSSVGGLVGFLDPATTATVTASYWDTSTSGQASSAEGTGKTTAELQTPADNSGIYANWGAAQWDFGTSSQYPVLKANFDGQGATTWQEFGHQLRAGPTSLTVTTDDGARGVELDRSGHQRLESRAGP